MGREPGRAAQQAAITAERAKLMADVQVVTLWSDRPAPGQGRGSRMDAESLFWGETHIELIAIASSTGGPGMLRQILSALPGDMSIPIAIVQHITPNFSQGFAQWLDTTTELRVSASPWQRTWAPRLGVTCRISGASPPGTSTCS